MESKLNLVNENQESKADLQSSSGLMERIARLEEAVKTRDMLLAICHTRLLDMEIASGSSCAVYDAAFCSVLDMNARGGAEEQDCENIRLRSPRVKTEMDERNFSSGGGQFRGDHGVMRFEENENGRLCASDDSSVDESSPRSYRMGNVSENSYCCSPSSADGSSVAVGLSRGVSDAGMSDAFMTNEAVGRTRGISTRGMARSQRSNPNQAAQARMELGGQALAFGSSQDGFGSQNEDMDASGRNRKRGEKRRLCTFEGCCKMAHGPTYQFCLRHGGGYRCQFPNCTRSAYSTKYCSKHGGGPRCQWNGCIKGAISNSSFCRRHGGGHRCQFPNCANGARQGFDYCLEHGGFNPCGVAGCPNIALLHGEFCRQHNAELKRDKGGCPSPGLSTSGENVNMPGNRRDAAMGY